MALKRFVASLVLLSLLVTPALAGHWVTQEIKWQLTSQGTPYNPTGIYTRDTTYNVLAAGQTDTTGFFSLDGSIPFLRAPIQATATANTDTLLAAYLLFTPDSAGVTASTVSSVTVEIDGRIGGFGSNAPLGGWAQIDSVVSAGLSTRGVIAVPIKTVGVLANPVLTASPYDREYRLLAFSNLRARVTAATGLMSACRVFVRYWTDN